MRLYSIVFLCWRLKLYFDWIYCDVCSSVVCCLLGNQMSLGKVGNIEKYKFSRRNSKCILSEVARMNILGQTEFDSQNCDGRGRRLPQ